MYIYIWGGLRRRQGSISWFLHFLHIFQGIIRWFKQNWPNFKNQKKKIRGFYPPFLDFASKWPKISNFDHFSPSPNLFLVSWYERGMLFWTIWYQSRFTRPKIDFTRIIFVKKTWIFPKFCRSKRGVWGSSRGDWGVKFGIFTLFSYLSMYYHVI